MNDIQFIDVDPSTSRVTFKLVPKQVKGMPKLIQIVVFSLFNIAGRDVLNPDQGGGLPSLLGANFDPNDPNELLAETALMIKKSESEIITNQTGIDDAPTEKLSSLQLISIVNGDTLDAINVTIRITNEAGQSANVLV